MNIDQAKALSLPEILLKLGHQPVRQRGLELWYLSPFRAEKTPSFHVHTTKNIWYDCGAETGGDTLSFVCAHLRHSREDHTVHDALRWLRNMQGVIAFVPRQFQVPATATPSLKLKRLSALSLPPLLNYLAARGIPADLARRYYKEAQVYNDNTGKYFTAISFANEDGGHELRNAFFKGSLAPKRVTFLRGTVSPSREIHIFEGSMDFISAMVIARRVRPEHDTIVLNSLSCLRYAIPYIRNYSYKTLCVWLDNDKAGDNATIALHSVAREQRLSFRDMRPIYQPHKDLNEYLMHRMAR